MRPVGRGARAGIAAAAACAALLALEARAQVDVVRGRPEVPEQKPQYDTRTADEDSLASEIADVPDPVVTLDGAGAPASMTRTAPRYPDAALRSGLQGTVRLVARVARDGSVAGVRVVKSVPGLDRAATDAVKTWTFQPVRVQGRPVEQEVEIPIRFLLPPDSAFDWRAARAAGAASERAGRRTEAFERYLAGFRAALADSAPAAESLRADVARAAGGIAPDHDLRVPPVEAWLAMSRGDSLAARAAAAESHAAALAAYLDATGAAPWHPPLYRRLAAAQERAGDRAGAARSLALYLEADPRASDRRAVLAALTRLRAPAAESR